MTRIPSISDIFSKIANSKAAKYVFNPRAAGAAVAIATISNVTKDGVNCAYYVTQSLHNERIPEDQRKFVAGLDLANGILNVTLQSIAGTLLGKAAADLFEKKITPKYFSEEVYKEMYKKLSSVKDFEKFKNFMETNKTFTKLGVSVFTALVGMQIVVKRIIVPLIATPLASVFKNHFEKSEQAKKAKEEKKDSQDLQIAVA